MSISGKILYDKVRNLHSDLSSVITPEILEKTCNEPVVQPFLKWFCGNVNSFNIISNEDIQIKNKLQGTNEWLEGTELDNALEEATRSCPDLLKIISFDNVDIDGQFSELEIAKNAYEEDENYINTLQNGIENLKKLESKLDEDLENEEAILSREYIKTDKAYMECSAIVKEFDESNRKFSKEIKCLLNIYADAAENKGAPLLWTQMPLELFISKIELYNHYLDVYIEQQFKNIHKEEQKTDSNYVSLMYNSKEKYIDNEKLQELSLCNKTLTNAKIKLILAKVQEDSYIAMLNHVQNIYNSGNLKIPRQSELRTEISKLTRKRDLLEENVSLLQEHQLTEIVQQFAELEITKILKENADTKLEETKLSLERLKNLRYLAREHGHAYTDLLCILMEMQFHRLKNVSEFVADVYHYLKMEYLLSSARCESMQQEQTKYFCLVNSSSKEHNSFNQFFISMIFNGDNTCSLNSALDKYNEIMDENKNKKQLILKAHFNSIIHKLEVWENEVLLQYMDEIHKGCTFSFEPISYELETCYGETSNNLQKIQADVRKIRNQMKERVKADVSFEREKNILWQRFLVDSETLKRIHKKMKETANKSCFAQV
ncbi:HAUS augmin-like complex subunit 3 [Osmia bicornis bicornis]|uniref:HAUS augmin-like complex subunit 3 n=1 Tax=Osmia bicornis bicornis TaxID=1437191 RepID=UPI001EAEF852|nr:HAUS augmin-like complex subunit 3 [Osmia bicornis bicornis]